MRPALVWIMAVVSGCGSPEMTTSEPVVRDSVGIRIVEHAAVGGGTPLIGLAPNPLWAHGGGQGDYQFASITAGVLLADGSAVVADIEINEVVAIASDGSLRSVLARNGEGPGEVGWVRSLIALGGDSVLVEDDRNHRFSIFVGDRFLGSTSTYGLMEHSSDLEAHGVDRSGSLLMSSQGHRRPEAEWRPGFMVRAQLEGATVDTVAIHDKTHADLVGDPLYPFAPRGGVAVSAGEFVIARSDVPEVVWRRSDGSIRQIVRWRPTWEYPTDDELDRHKASQLERAGSQISDAELADMADLMDELYRVAPERPLPLFSRIHGDDAGRVWLAEHVVTWPTDEPTAYTVIDFDGAWLGTIRLPWEFRLLAVRGDWVLGVVKDELDIQTVVVHELLGTGSVERPIDPGR